MKGKCVIFCAPSGAGKTTIVRHLLDLNLGLSFSISATSRERRQSEIEGKDYYYFSVTEFKKRIKEEAFLEWEEVYKDNFYGTLKTETDRIWNDNKHVIFDVDVVGGLNLKHEFGDQAIAIFVKPPSINHLETRLRKRHTETEQSILRRVGKAGIEMQMAEQFDYVLLNDDLEKALIEAEKVVTDFLKS